MGGYLEYHGKHPEELKPPKMDRVMPDHHFLLFQQCLRDARELHVFLEHFPYTDNPESYLSEWETYEKNVALMATQLFKARLKHPLTTDNVRKLLLGGESALADLEGVREQYDELLELVKKVQATKDEVGRLRSDFEKRQVEVRAKDFTRATLGEANYAALENKQFIDIIGSNGAVYRITRDGKIIKTTGGPFGSGKWNGYINETGGIPMDEAIATVYMHIIGDADKFDKDRSCGRIRIG